MTEGTSSNDTIITDIVDNDISITLEKLSIFSDKSSSNDVLNKESENLSNDTIDIFKPLIISAIETIRGKSKRPDFGSCNKNWVLSSILDKYRNHPSIVKIHKNRNLQSNSISIPCSSWGSKITPKEINTILKTLNSKKAPGIDKIPTKLV